MPSLFDYGGRFGDLALLEIENSNFKAYTTHLLINKNRSPSLSGSHMIIFSEVKAGTAKTVPAQEWGFMRVTQREAWRYSPAVCYHIGLPLFQG